MLIDFEVENFRSYREPRRFSFVASTIKEYAENLVTIPDLDLRILKTAAIYGANGSGKSNLLLAMQSLGQLLDSPINRRLSPSIHPFILDLESSANPTRFRSRFIADKTLFDYELGIQHGGVEKERLVAYPKGRPQEWFSRIGSDISFPSPNLRGQKRSLVSLTSEQSSFLAIANVVGHRQLSIPANWLITNLVDRFSFPRSRNLLDSSRNVSSVEATARRIQSDQDFHR